MSEIEKLEAIAETRRLQAIGSWARLLARIAPDRLVDDAIGLAEEKLALGENIGRAARRNPLSAAALAAGIGWFVSRAVRRSTRPGPRAAMTRRRPKLWSRIEKEKANGKHRIGD